MPAIGKQTYKPSDRRSSTRPPRITPEYRATVAADSIEPCQGRQAASPPASSATARGFTAIANSNGQLRLPEARPTSTSPAPCAPTTAAARAGSRATSTTSRSSTPAATSAPRSRRRSGSADAKALEPGKYTVILEPAAAAGLICVHDVRLRRAPGRRRPQLPVEEGRRQQARREDRSTSASTSVPIPWDPDAAGAAVGRRRPAARDARRSIDKGVVENLQYSRFWAQEAGQARDRPARQPDHGRRRQVDRRT